MKTSKNRNALLSLVALAALSACGGGGGGSSPSTASPGTTVSGKAVDGYIRGATVFCDANNDRTLNAGEASATTNGNGSFTLSSPCASTLVAVGGVDTDTNYAFSGLLSAPAGSIMVTPITTLLANSGITQAELLRSLNLPANSNVTQTDPLTDLPLWRKNLAVQQILHQMAHFFTSYMTPSAMHYERAARFLGETMLASPAPLFDASETVNENLLADALQDMAGSLGITPDNDDIVAAVQAFADQAGSYLLASNGATLVTIAKELQNPAKPPVQTPTQQHNYLALTDDTFRVNGQAHTLQQLQDPAGITVEGLHELQFEYTAYGMVSFDRTINLGLEVQEEGGSGRILQVKVEHLRLQRAHDTGAMTASPTPDTLIHIYAHDHQGIGVNSTLDGSNFNAVSASTNSLNINYEELVDKIASHPGKPANFNASQFLNLQGSFAVKAVVTHNLNARYSDGAPLPTVNVGIYNTHFGVTGYGIEGRVHIE